jgi:glycosyltransferase involved in cell wall biosynthesis
MLISVIIPVYNAGNYLQDCLESVFNNTQQVYEVILVNDGSTDNAIETVQKTFIKYIEKQQLKIISQENQGVSVARNTGLNNAIGEYVTFIDADDLVASSYIIEISKIITEHSPDVIEFGFKQFISLDDLGEEKYVLDFNGVQSIQEVLPYIYAKSTGYSWLRVFKKEAITKVSFPIGVRFCEDLMFCIDAFKQCETIYYLRKPLYLYRRNESGATLNVHEDYKLNILKYLKRSNISNSYKDALLKVNFAYVCYRCDFERNQFLILPFLTYTDFKLATIITIFDKRIELRKKLIALFPFSFRIYQLAKKRFLS